MHDSRTVLSDDFQKNQCPLGLRAVLPVGMNHDGQPFWFDFFQSADQSSLFFGGDLDAKDAAELAAQARHPAFEPVAAMFSHYTRHGIHQAWFVPTNHGHDQ